MLNPLNHHYALENPASIYDEEALTALELAGRTTAKVNETVEAFNALEKETGEHLAKQDGTIEARMESQDSAIQKMNDETMPANVTAEFQKNLNNGTFEDMVNTYTGDLKGRVDNLLGQVTEGSTTLDAEVIDMRVGADGNTHPNAGEAVRSQYSAVNLATQRNATIITPNYYNVGEGIAYTLVTEKLLQKGNLVEYTTMAGFCVTEIIPVTPGQKVYFRSYCRYKNDIYALYDASGNVVDYFNDDASSGKVYEDIIVIPAGVTGLRIANANSGDTLRIETADVKLQADKISAKTVDFVQLSDALSGAFTPDKFSSATITYEEYPNHILRLDGSVYAYTDYKCWVSDFFEVKGTAYLTGSSFMMAQAVAYYDQDHRFIGAFPGHNDSTYVEYHNLLLDVPSNAKYMRVGKFRYGPNLIETTVNFVETYKVDTPGNWSHLKWCCVGDSLTEKNNRSTKHYYDYIHDKTGITVVNLGDSGTGYKKTEESNTAFYQRISGVPTDVDVVTIFGSGNDLSYSSVLGDINDTGTDTICGCINTTIDNLYAILPTVQLGIVAPSPWVNNTPSDNRTMARYCEALEAICKNRSIPYLDLFHRSGLRPNDENFRNLAYSKDEGNGVHPDETGHKMIASQFYNFLQSLIGIF